MALDNIIYLMNKRDDLQGRLMKALAHLPIERQYQIILSFMSVEMLEDVVKFQEGNNQHEQATDARETN